MQRNPEREMAEHVVEFGKDGGSRKLDGRLDAPAFHRNHQAILGVLAPYLTEKSGDAVEIGSGTGQHVVEFARQFPDVTWWPSDPNDNHLNSIEAWRVHSGLVNIRPPRRIDVSDPLWGEAITGEGGPGELLAVFCANVIHIAPWAVAAGLVAGAGRCLRKGGLLFFYGPFKREGRHTAESNEAFDASLRRSNPEWGVRDVEAVERLAVPAGLALVEIAAMPANNFALVFSRK
jgi:SAM-dependent methyltransferase